MRSIRDGGVFPSESGGSELLLTPLPIRQHDDTGWLHVAKQKVFGAIFVLD